jgi:hypothetical protein
MGHSFVVFNFDAADKTYVYNTTTGLWHECVSRDPLKDLEHRWVPNYAIQRATAQNTQILIGSRSGNKIYELRTGYTTEDGNLIRRIRVTSHLNNEQQMFKVTGIRFDMETGLGISAEDSARFTQAPTAMLRYSHDRANTWSSTITRGCGRTGQYQTTVEFPPLGAARNFTVEYSIIDPCSTTVINGYIWTKQASKGRIDG